MFEIKAKFSKTQLIYTGTIVALLTLWNGVCDYIYAYSSEMSGLDYFSPMLFDLLFTANNRSHTLIMIAQTAGWLYPIYALSYFLWYAVISPSNKRVIFPLLLLSYAIIMIGGIQHAGFAFLSVVKQAELILSVNNNSFNNLVQQLINEHFLIGDLTAIFALFIGGIWLFLMILLKKTNLPSYASLYSPFGVYLIVFILGIISPAPIAGLFLGLFGTWMLLIPTIYITYQIK